MTVSLYQISVPIFIQHLNALSTILDKAAAYAEAKKLDPAVMLEIRLFPDMFPLVRQVRAVTDHAISASARLAGKDVLKFDNTETGFPALKERIAKAVAFLQTIKAAEIDGQEERDISITFPSGATRQFKGQGLLLGNSLPNFYFHLTTAYNILREIGVDIGKRDFMGTPPA